MSEKPTETPHDYINSIAKVSSNYTPVLERLDQRLKYIGDQIWPDYPYLLTVPSARSYHLTEQQAADLQRYTHFDIHEQRLQYMSFLATGWESTLITAVGAWEDEKNEGTSVSSRSQKMQSASNTPKVAAKKISMSEYKKRTTVKSSVHGLPNSNPQVKAEERSSTPAGTSVTQVQTKSHLKRSSDAVEEKGRTKDGQALKGEHPAKRPKPSTQAATDSKSVTERPVLDLPPPLSPTLPEFVEKLLARAEESKAPPKEPNRITSDVASRTAIGASKKQSTQVAPQNQDSDSNKKGKQSHADKNQPIRKSNLNSSEKLRRADGNKPLTNGTKSHKASDEERPQQARVSATASDSPSIKSTLKSDQRHIDEKPKLTSTKIMVLKIPRRIRTDVQRILKLQPRPKPKSQEIKNTKTSERSDLRTINGTNSSTSKISERPDTRAAEEDNSLVRPRPDKDRPKDHGGKTVHRAAEKGISESNQTSQKRPRHDEDSDLPPQNKRFKSPVLSNRASVKRPKEVTPISMREDTVGTPQGSIMNGTPAAPNSIERPAKESRHTPSDSGSSQSASSEAIEIFRKEQVKYSELGVALKKESDRIYKAGQDSKPPSAQMKRYLAMRIEVTLCFMLAYIIGDETHRLRRGYCSPPNATWGTLFPWLQQLVQQTAEHPHMCGLAYQLEAICLMVAWNTESEQISHSGLRESETIKRLREQYDDAQRKFLEGTARLSVDDLQVEFPRTWRAKSQAPLACSAYKLTKETLNGDFYLPITSITLPVEAVRAARNLLGEWCRSEGVDWTAKLNF